MESQTPIVKKKETRGRKPKPKEEKKEEAGKVKEGKKAQLLTVDDKYTQWKSLVPVLYDWLANHNLVWPSLSCRYTHTLSPPSGGSLCHFWEVLFFCFVPKVCSKFRLSLSGFCFYFFSSFPRVLSLFSCS